MGFEFVEKTLSSGKKVTLVDWEDLSPTQHGKALHNRPWDEANGRTGLGFYASTSEYMHNDWASQHMAPTPVTLPGAGSLMLYHNAATDTWHSADALDIDHVAQWKDHFAERGVQTHADAHMAYNDVGNLRLLPAPVNRAREAAFDVLARHGADSPQWQRWVEDRFAFDPQTQRFGFDPEVDGAERKRTTKEQPWRPEDGRKGLSFDAGVLGTWYDHKLKECWAGEVELKSPTSGKTITVPLFHCQASGQLCTRDAFDIDHRIPFEVLGPQMAKHAGPGGLSKADALDGYNETSNLRLVGRSVNSSHDFEMEVSGEYRDEAHAPERPGEFDDLIVDDGRALGPQLKEQLRELGRAYRVPETLMSDPGHPGCGLYRQALSQLERSDVGRAMSAQERSNAAGVLTLAATAGNLRSIDQVVAGDNGSKLFAIQGDPKDGHFAWGSLEQAKQQPLVQTTLELNQLNHERSQAQANQQQQQQRVATMH